MRRGRTPTNCEVLAGRPGRSLAEHERAGHEQLRIGAGVVGGSSGRSATRDVAGLADESAELGGRNGMLIHPEAVDRNPVHRPLLRVEVLEPIRNVPSGIQRIFSVEIAIRSITPSRRLSCSSSPSADEVPALAVSAADSPTMTQIVATPSSTPTAAKNSPARESKGEYSLAGAPPRRASAAGTRRRCRKIPTTPNAIPIASNGQARSVR